VAKIIDNRYEVIGELGRGGMGVVYKVKDLLNDKFLALKMLSLEASQSVAIRRFKNEFYFLTQLRHPNLVEVYDFGTTADGNYYFTMEYVRGKNLKQAVRGLSYDECYFLLVQVLRALQYIHFKGIIHYDIKPSNILITQIQDARFKMQDSRINSEKGKALHGSQSMFHAKLMDFGLAGEVVSGSTGLVIRGTLNYIAPEMVKGVGVDCRADLYSFGVVLYELFTGTLPFKGDTSVVLLKEHLEKIPDLPRNLNPEIPEALQGLIMKLLAKEPSERFFSANEVIEAINNLCKKKFALETKETKESYILSGKFVGRERELEKLKSAYTRLPVSMSPGLPVSVSPGLPVSPSPGLILISGESGIGKTRLLQEFRYYVQLERGRFFLGHCYPSANVPYQPFLEVLRHLVLYAEGIDIGYVKKYGGVLKKLLPEIGERDYMRGVPELVALGPKEEKIRLFSMVTDFIKNLPGNIVIAFEDLHWADEGSLELLGYLVRSLRIENAKILICGTYRKEEVLDGHPLSGLISGVLKEESGEVLELSPFSATEVTELVGSMVGFKGDLEVIAQRLYSKTGGNPFFLTEVLKGVIEEIPGELGSLDLSIIERVGVPKTIGDVLSRRLSRVSLDAFELLKVASVLGRRFDLEFFKGLGLYDEIKLYQLIRELVRKHILIEIRFDSKMCYDFVHSKMKEFIYGGLTKDEKGRFHQLVGRRLEELFKGRLEDVVEELAGHYIWFDEKRAFYYLVQAGKKMANLYAYSEAIRYYTQAIDLIQKDKGFFNIKDEIEVYGARGGIFKVIGRYDQALSDINKALELTLRSGDLEQAADYFHLLNWIYNIKEKDGLIYAKECMETARRLKNKKALAIGLLDMGYGYRFLMKWKRSLHYFRRSINILKRIKEKKYMIDALSGMGDTWLNLGRYKDALLFYRRALKIAERLNHKSQVALTLHKIAGIYFDKRELRKAISYTQSALKIFQEIGDKYQVCTTIHNLAVIYLELDENKEALDYFQRGLKLAYEIDVKGMIGPCLLNIGHLYYRIGKYEKSLNYSSQALQIIEDTKMKDVKAYIYRNMGTVFSLLGQYEKALDYLYQGLKIGEENNLKMIVALILRGIAPVHTALHDYKKAFNSLNRSIKIFKKIGNKTEVAISTLMLGEIYIELTDYDRAKTCVNVAMKWAKQKGIKEILIQGNLLLSKIYYGKGDLSNSFISLKEAAGVHSLTDPEILWQIDYQKGQIYQKQRKFNEALDAYKRCLEIFKEVCANISDKELQKSYLNAPPRKKVFTAIEEIEKKMEYTGK